VTERVVAQGTEFGSLVDAATDLDPNIRHGEVVTLRLSLAWVPWGFTNTADAALRVGGVHLTEPVRATDNGIVIRWRRNLGPLAVVAIIAGLALVIGLLVGWVMSVGTEAAGSVMSLGAVVLGLLVLSQVLPRKRRGKRAVSD